MVDGRFWRWALRSERPAIVHVTRDSVGQDQRHIAVPEASFSSAVPVAFDPQVRAAAAIAPAHVTLILKDHSVHKPGQMAPIFNRVNLKFTGGRTYFILGVNGVGKTLFLRSLPKLGLTCALEASDGSKRRRVCYFTSRDRVCEEPLTVEVLLRMANARPALQSWGLSACATSRVQSLSQGEKTRLALAIAEASKALVLLLDEPTLGLDQAGFERLDRLLERRREEGLVTLVASHELIFYRDDCGELLLFEHDHERTRISHMSANVLRGQAVFTKSDGERATFDGAMPEIAKRLLDMQHARLRGEE